MERILVDSCHSDSDIGPGESARHQALFADSLHVINEGERIMKNFFRFIVLPVIAVAVVANLKDLRRYLKIRAM